jgi:hypothetical protein
MRHLLLLLLACDPAQPEAIVVTEDVVHLAAASVRSCLTEAGKLSQQGRRAAAKEQVFGCYRAHFEPIEPVLRSHNRRATLSLEYGFGRVASVVGRANSTEAAATVVAQLSDRVEGVLDALPTVPAPILHPKDTGTAPN